MQWMPRLRSPCCYEHEMDADRLAYPDLLLPDARDLSRMLEDLFRMLDDPALYGGLRVA